MKLKSYTTSVFRKLKSQDETKVITILVVIILALGVILSYVLYGYALIRQNNQKARYVNQEKSKLTSYLQNRFSLYENLLINGSGTVSLIKPENISKDDWSRYISSLEIDHRTPALLGVGLARVVPADQINDFEEKMRSQGFTDYKITPDYPRDFYTAIQYIEPNNDVNKNAYGFDMFTEKSRHEAMVKSRDTNKASMTAPVLLQQDLDIADSKKPKSLLIYFPVYRSVTVNNTKEQREANLIGYTYAIARINDIFANLKNLDTDTEYKISDITSSDQVEDLFNYGSYSELNGTKSNIASETIDLAGRKWQISVYAKTTNENIFNYPITIFFISLAGSIMVAWFIYNYLNKRFRFVREVYKNEVEQSKNDLLALASHQLRTPATGVRQYVSMLINGYFGKLTDEQLAIALKAHMSNERQLEVIDQILYVAKADINQLAINFEKTNISKLTEDIIDTMKDTTNQKRITTKFTSKPKVINCVIDKKYMRMIIENLLSNAIKYSYPDTEIYVNVRKKHKTIKLSIKDSGVGISKNDFEKLFLKFSRIPNALSQKEGGTGLGLFLAKKLAEAHQGSIEVISEDDRGSEFILSIPAKLSNQ